ncbi:unnamed protein product [Rangifer tarandus platyrhynchus]|uniref:Uncharacterized protein n=1 Tax=Rangifer tarandus platyrhynchus TaxID=3082113 RepID=A0AC59ZIW6_RANTA
MAGSATTNPLQTLQEEAVCAICLDYFKDPVSIGCGHNFCRGCVTQLWGKEDNEQDREGEEDEWEEDEDDEEAFTCPQCRKSFKRRSFRPNLQLANMVQIIRQMCPTPNRESRVNDQGICSKHQEALKLYCEVDKEAICVICRESRSHKQHSVVPLDEVVHEYKVQLLTAVSQVRLFKLGPLYCGCTLDLFFTQTCYTPEILNSNCTMNLALCILVQLNTLQLYMPFIFMEATVPLTPNFFLSPFIRHLLALLTILLTLYLKISLSTKN